MNYISYPEIHAPQQQQSSVSQDSIKSTDHVDSVVTMQHSRQTNPKFDWKFDWSKFDRKFDWPKFNQTVWTAQSMDSLQTKPKFDQKFNQLKFNQTAQEEHRVSSPRYPQSNGMAERYVQTMKASLLKTIEEGEDGNLALLTYKTMPLNHSLPSPAELLNSRKYKTLLPTWILPTRLQESYRQIMDRGKQMQAQLYDKNTRPTRTIKKPDRLVESK